MEDYTYLFLMYVRRLLRQLWTDIFVKKIVFK